MEEEKKKKLTTSLTYIKKTYKYAKDDKKYLIYFLIACIFFSIISVVAPLLSARRIVALTEELWEQLLYITVIIFVIEIGRNFIRFWSNYCTNKFFYAVKKNIQLETTKETLRIDTQTLNSHSSGIFIERINNDTSTMADIFITIIDYLSEIISNIGILLGIFFLNKIIFLVYLFFLLILFFGQKYAANRIQEKRKEMKKRQEIASGFTSEMVRGAKDLKVLNAEKAFLKKADRVIDDVGISTRTFNKTRANFRLINGSIRDFLDLTIILVGIYFMIHGDLEVATMLIIFSYRGNIMSISGLLENFMENLKRFTLSAEKVFAVIDNDTFSKESFGKKDIGKVKGHITFQNVSFSYMEGQEVLKKVSFHINPNETVSFVGKSGSGKSTIFHLIAHLYTPTSGQILFDGIPITELNKDSIRGNLSIISQNPYIFNMSIRENLQIIKSDLTEKEMIEACKMACLHDFILTLKDGYDTIVGESGVTLVMNPVSWTKRNEVFK